MYRTLKKKETKEKEAKGNQLTERELAKYTDMQEKVLKNLREQFRLETECPYAIVELRAEALLRQCSRSTNSNSQDVTALPKSYTDRNQNTIAGVVQRAPVKRSSRSDSKALLPQSCSSTEVNLSGSSPNSSITTVASIPSDVSSEYYDQFSINKYWEDGIYQKSVHPHFYFDKYVAPVPRVPSERHKSFVAKKNLVRPWRNQKYQPKPESPLQISQRGKQDCCAFTTKKSRQKFMNSLCDCPVIEIKVQDKKDNTANNNSAASIEQDNNPTDNTLQQSMEIRDPTISYELALIPLPWCTSEEQAKNNTKSHNFKPIAHSKSQLSVSISKSAPENKVEGTDSNFNFASRKTRSVCIMVHSYEEIATNGSTDPVNEMKTRLKALTMEIDKFLSRKSSAKSAPGNLVDTCTTVPNVNRASRKAKSVCTMVHSFEKAATNVIGIDKMTNQDTLVMEIDQILSRKSSGNSSKTDLGFSTHDLNSKDKRNASSRKSRKISAHKDESLRKESTDLPSDKQIRSKLTGILRKLDVNYHSSKREQLPKLKESGVAKARTSKGLSDFSSIRNEITNSRPSSRYPIQEWIKHFETENIAAKPAAKHEVLNTKCTNSSEKRNNGMEFRKTPNRDWTMTSLEKAMQSEGAEELKPIPKTQITRIPVPVNTNKAHGGIARSGPRIEKAKRRKKSKNAIMNNCSKDERNGSSKENRKLQEQRNVKCQIKFSERSDDSDSANASDYPEKKYVQKVSVKRRLIMKKLDISNEK